MSKVNVFIDGSAGTTGLRIHERLADRKDLSLIILSDELRKDPSARKEALCSADIAFLCLPDDAARESVSLAEGSGVAIIDTSTAHRTVDGWEYGFPELMGRKERIASSKRIGNPGCHASGFIALVEPLVREGVISRDALLNCYSVTGYSGGGKKMIAEYEGYERDPLLDAPRMYALGQQHKHLKEMTKICGIDNHPVFCPIVAPFYSGMEVSVPLHRSELGAGADQIKKIYRDYYADGLVRYADGDESGFLSAGAYTGRDDMQICVSGNEERIVLVARYDNLGKGASGAAIQNMNLLLGVDQAEGLNV